MPRFSLIEDNVLGHAGVLSVQVSEIVDGLPGYSALVVQLELDANAAANPGPVVRAALETVWRQRSGDIPSGQLRVWTRRPDGLRIDLRPQELLKAAGFRGARAAGDDIVLRHEWLSTEFGLP